MIADSSWKPNKMMPVDEYAAQPHTPQVRTVRKALAEGRIPDARMETSANGRKQWLIPANAEILPVGMGVIERADPAPAPATILDQPRLVELLDRETAYLPLKLAARLLGVHPDRIKEDPDAFEAKPWGERKALLVPQSFIRRMAGIA